MQHVIIIGAGLAGCECAWQLSRRGLSVTIYEMKPGRFSPAHVSPGMAELVCSNSLRSEEETTAIGMLKEEMLGLDSLIMQAALAARVPAGKALAVDRERFSAFIEEKLSAQPGVRIVREEIASLDDPRLDGADAVVVAAGPLASDTLAEDLKKVVGGQELYFYDAIAPIVAADSVDMDVAFWGSRYRPEDTDYLNCPFTEDEYRGFVAALLAAETVPSREFEKMVHFEGCLPVEELASRGEMTLAFGPLKPVGLVDPRTGEQPFAVLQLRTENLEKTTLNMVGFQTKLRYPEQERVFRTIPGLARAEFTRLGSIHRNTFVNAPRVLADDLSLKARPGVYLAGQITGVEGYLESAACGLWVGLLLAQRASGREHEAPPRETALGGLLGHLRTETKDFQPSNANFGLTPPLNKRAGKQKRKLLYAERARERFAAWKDSMGL